MRRCLLIAGAGMVGLWSHAAMAANTQCDDLLPTAAVSELAAVGQKRTVTALDLTRLRDVGPVYASIPTVPLLTVSPDKKHVAFQVRRADPIANGYCLGMVVVNLAMPGQARLVDVGGEYLPAPNNEYGLVHIPVGFPATITPQWSPDGLWIAYLRRDNGITQIWQARADGNKSEAITHSVTDVEAFAWSRDGTSIVYATTPDDPGAAHADEVEAKSGYLYDDRFLPVDTAAPYRRASSVKIYQMVQVLNGRIRNASPEEQTWLKGAPCGPSNALRTACAADRAAWIAPADTGPGETTVQMTREGKGQACAVKACSMARDVWWSADGKNLYFLSRTGWASDRLSIYRWQTGEKNPTLVYETTNALIGCQYESGKLICAEEASDRPRHLISIDLSTGQSAPLYELNPEFASIKLGGIKHLQWTNNVGIKTFGDLLLPPDHLPGQRHPLILVGYDSRGFLRGGTGDEYPIQLLAAHGFAVLSFERPMDYGSVYGSGKTDDEVERLNRQNWADRRSVLSSMEVGIQMAISTGAVEAERVGLTGFSDGSSSARFALINGHISYGAVAISQCCEDMTTLALMNETARKRRYDMGYPQISDDPASFWSAYSVRLNTAKFNAPMLIQTSDDEFRYGLEAVTALQEKGRPVDMYVFPGEHHVKWQPAHRLAVYERNVDWFDFWLKDVVDPDPSKAGQYKRWKTMRDLPARNMGAPHSG